jgi:glycosyltransferase involved in cell wall biosynthesis
MDVVCVIPAYNAERSVGHVVASLASHFPGRARERIIVVNDGSNDATAELARRAGAYVLGHAHNRGKGAALRTGLQEAARRGAQAVVTLDADGQHFAEDALRLAEHPAAPSALILGVRDLANSAAPRANQFSNGLSNFFLSWFSGVNLKDTQCGLRRYPVAQTLACAAHATGFAFETEVVLIAALQGWPLVQVPVSVHYALGAARSTHFHNVKDPARIIASVLQTMARHHLQPSRRHAHFG